MCVKQAAHTRHRVGFIFHRHFQKQSCVGQKGRFHPTEFFQGIGRSNPTPAISEDNSQVRKGKEKKRKKKKKTLRCQEFCFVLSHAAKPKQSLRSEINKQLCSIPPLLQSLKAGLGPTCGSACFHTEVRSPVSAYSCHLSGSPSLPFPRPGPAPGPLPRAYLAPPFPRLVDLMGKPKSGNRQQVVETRKGCVLRTPIDSVWGRRPHVVS